MDNPKISSRFKAARAGMAPHLRSPVAWRSWWQVANSLGAFVAVSTLIHVGVAAGYWLSLALVPLAAGLLVRVFIIQHDCGHGAFFKSTRANDWLGRVCGVLTLTPYDYWRRQHHGHHTRWNCLDRRGPDIDPYSKCLTVDEYRALSPLRRWLYRLQRHPVVMFLLVPPLIFFVFYRIPFAVRRERRRARISVHLTTAAIAVAAGGMILLVGGVNFALVQIPINVVASIAGAWLFFVQHQFDGSAWVRRGEWEFGQAVGDSSSFLKLPPVLRWFSGNIGFHHIHHFDYRIPNYHLARCQPHFAKFQAPREISLGAGLRATRLTLWDEAKGALVRFADVRVARPA